MKPQEKDRPRAIRCLEQSAFLRRFWPLSGGVASGLPIQARRDVLSARNIRERGRVCILPL